MYLADAQPPSEGELEENAYILNLSSAAGGYIDGAALDGMDRWSLSERNLADNPSACGNTVNHSSDTPNVEMVSFQWLEVFEDDSSTDDDKELLPLPNELRADGSPWYLDGFTGEIVPFPSPADVRRDFDKRSSTSVDPLLFGAAFCSQQDLEEGTEILLDYKLKRPYPSWAQEWYK